MGEATVTAVGADSAHRFSKQPKTSIELVTGEGVVGDAHRGVTVKHRSRVAADPDQPNLRQVHLLHCELFEGLSTDGFDVSPCDLGENITTRGLDLLGLSRGTQLMIGPAVVLEVTGLRNPCSQIEAFQPGLLSAVLGKRADGTIIRKAGIMAIVVCGGTVTPGDTIGVRLPDGPHVPLERV